MAGPLSVAERAFADRMRASQAKVDAAETATLRRMIDDVQGLRGEVMGELARLAPGDADGWRAKHLKDVQRHLDRVLGEWADAMAGNLNDGVRVAADAGHAALAAAAGGTSGAAVTKQAQQDSFAVHRRQLEQSYAYNADLVQGVASEARDAIMSRLRRGVTGQKNPVEVMRDIQKYLDVPARPTGKFGGIAYQAERVVRTEMSRMYNLSNVASMDATAEALGPDAGLQTMWLHSGVSKGARPSHVALDGTTVPYGETFDVEGYAATGPHDPALPAEHVVNCFLPGTRVRGVYEAGLKAHYSGPAREIETRRGVRLAVTINHPVLTASGWVKAGDLREGDRLISDPSDVWDRLAPDDEHGEDVPPAIEDVFEALALDRRVRLPVVGALDLYGDGRFINGDVHVVTADGALMGDGQPGVQETNGEVGFVEPGLVAGDLVGKGAAGQLVVGDRATTNGIMGGPGEILAFVGRELAHADIAAFRPPPHRDALFAQSLDERRAGHADIASERQAGLAGKVAPNGVVGEGRVLAGAGPAANRGGLLGDVRGPLGGVLSLEPRQPLVVRGSENHAAAGEGISDGATGAAGELLQRLYARTGQIALDEIVGIRDFTFDGHVYDLQSHDGLIIADGVVCSNCKCTAVMTSPAWGVDVAGTAKAGRDERAAADKARADARSEDG